MPKNKVPSDPMDGLPDAPFLVEGGVPIHEALANWSHPKQSRHQHPEDHFASQEHWKTKD